MKGFYGHHMPDLSGSSDPESTDANQTVAARPYLMAWRLDGRKVVVVGGGSIGTGKVETLLGSGARLIVIDPTPSARVEDLAARGELELRRRRACPLDLRGASLVVAATGESDMNRRVRRWATLGGLLKGVVVNAVDDTANCDVTVPAVIHRGPATVAITTGGATPAGARFVREELTKAVDDALPPEFGAVLDHAASARHELRETGRYRYDYPSWRQGYFEPAVAALRSGGVGAVKGRRDAFVDWFSSTTDRLATPSAATPNAATPNAAAPLESSPLELSDRPLRAGRVSLVGAGPGGADLITVRGSRALASADVVVYDRLIDPELLNLAPPAAERIPVGKGKGWGTTQEAINELLISRASAGCHVIRLKGGDPFVFGRGGEEVTAVTHAGLDIDVVPGVSSAVAGPALACIPVTDRRVAAAYTVISGHRASADESVDEEPADTARWRALGTTTDTVVVLMAASTAREVARRLVREGRSALDPVAFVHGAGTAEQRTERSSLGQAALEGCPLPSPTVMVIGGVVSLSNPAALRESVSESATLGEPVTDRRAADDALPAVSGSASSHRDLLV